nr:TM2 domain-containing protein [uncultured Chryseobacterium sp.]
MKNKTSAALLAFFLGGLGIHQFYLGNTGKGIIYLLFCWTLIPSLVAFIEFLLFLTMDERSFNIRYNQGFQLPPVQSVQSNSIPSVPIQQQQQQQQQQQIPVIPKNSSYADYVRKTDLHMIENTSFENSSYEWCLNKMIKNYREIIRYPKKEDAPGYMKFKEYEAYVNKLNADRNDPQVDYWNYFSAFIN